MIVYFNGKYIDKDEVKISPFDRGFQYADGVYEVLRTYNGKYFRYEDHLNRLIKSLSEIGIVNITELNFFTNIFKELILKNDLARNDVVIYIQITRGSYFPRRHIFPPEGTKPTVIVVVNHVKQEPEININGIKIILEKDIRWARCDIKSVSLLPNVLAAQKARDKNADEAIWIKDGFLTEGAHTNFFGIKEETVYTFPLSNNILAGVTRTVVFEICNELNLKVKEEGIKENEVTSFDEFFITGTTTEVRPVIQIDDWTVGNGKPGIITKNIQSEFYKITANI